jgi:DNA repair exonuclease SbcCD nuclease subunit
MKIIHTSDLHLDSRLSIRFTKEQAAIRRRELMLTFSRMIGYAKDEGVKAMIIAGDLFDGSTPRASTADAILKDIAGAPNIDFLYLKGNHEADFHLWEEGNVPPNLKCFHEDWKCFDYGEVSISGVQLSKRNFSSFYDAIRPEAGKINIVVLHGQAVQTGTKDNLCKINLKKLQNKNIDYLALGDYHSYTKGKLDNRGEYCYCGCPEGRGFDETGDKGFVLLDCQRGSVKSEFIPFSKRRILSIDADISGLTTTAQINDAADEAVKNLSPFDIIRLRLTGECPLELFRDIRLIEQKLKDTFFYAEAEDAARLAINPADYVHGVSLKSEFVRLVLADPKLSPEQKDSILKIGFAALCGEDLPL